MNRNKLIVFSAPSGAGKTTLVKHILSQFSNTSFSISATSRSPRGNEKDWVDYHFLSKSEFKKKINNNEFYEYAKIYDNYYGTSKKAVNDLLEKNKKNIKIKNFKQWLALWEKAKESRVGKYAFKYPLPTYKTNKRDLSKLI